MAASEKMDGEGRVGWGTSQARAKLWVSPTPRPLQPLPLPLGQGPGPLIPHPAGSGAPQVLHEGTGEATAGPWDQGNQWTGDIHS